MHTSDKLIDGLALPCSQKHPLVIARVRALAPLEHFVLRNSHAPEPLRVMLESVYPDALRWEYLRDEPGLAEVRITKLRSLTPAEIAHHDRLLAGRAPGAGCGVHRAVTPAAG